MSESRKWFALRVNADLKEKVIGSLESKGIKCLAPVSNAAQAGRKIISNEPGFIESLLFIKTEETLFATIKHIKGIENFLYWRNSLATINEKEILLLRYFAEIRKDLFFEKIPVDAEGEVIIISGTFLLKEGDSYDVKRKAVKAVLPTLGYIVAAETDDDLEDPVRVLKAQEDISFDTGKR